MRVFGIAELWGKAYNPAVTAAKIGGNRGEPADLL
jgi:hypothetical protein